MPAAPASASLAHGDGGVQAPAHIKARQRCGRAPSGDCCACVATLRGVRACSAQKKQTLTALLRAHHELRRRGHYSNDPTSHLFGRFHRRVDMGYDGRRVDAPVARPPRPGLSPWDEMRIASSLPSSTNHSPCWLQVAHASLAYLLSPLLQLFAQPVSLPAGRGQSQLSHHPRPLMLGIAARRSWRCSCLARNASSPSSKPSG